MQENTINRKVVGFGPLISIVCGVAAAWLLNHVPGLDVPQAALADALVDAVAFTVGAVLPAIAQHKWLSGWQQMEQASYELDHMEQAQADDHPSADPLAALTAEEASIINHHRSVVEEQATTELRPVEPVYDDATDAEVERDVVSRPRRVRIRPTDAPPSA